MKNDLVDDNFMENAADLAKQETAVEEKVLDTNQAHLEPDEDFEAPASNFFDHDTKDEPEESGQDSDEISEAEESISKPSGETARKYKANGEEYEFDVNNEEHVKEAMKALSLMRGSRKELSKVGRYKHKIKQQEVQLTKSKEKAEYFDKLDEIHKKDGVRGVYKAISGENLDDLIQRELEKARLKSEATPDQLALMEKEEKLAMMESRMKAFEEQQVKSTEERQRERIEAKKESLQSALVPEFQQYFGQFDGYSPATQNKLKQMLWKSTLDDLAGYAKQGYDVSKPSVYKKVLANNAKALNILKQKGSSDIANKVIESKKKEAVESAQVASTANYPNVDVSDKMKKANPLDLFRMWSHK